MPEPVAPSEEAPPEYGPQGALRADLLAEVDAEQSEKRQEYEAKQKLVPSKRFVIALENALRNGFRQVLRRLQDPNARRSRTARIAGISGPTTGGHHRQQLREAVGHPELGDSTGRTFCGSHGWGGRASLCARRGAFGKSIRSAVEARGRSKACRVCSNDIRENTWTGRSPSELSTVCHLNWSAIQSSTTEVPSFPRSRCCPLAWDRLLRAGCLLEPDPPPPPQSGYLGVPQQRLEWACQGNEQWEAACGGQFFTTCRTRRLVPPPQCGWTKSRI